MIFVDKIKCLDYFKQQHIASCGLMDSLWTRKKALSPWRYKYSGSSSSLYVCQMEIGGQSKRWFAMNALS